MSIFYKTNYFTSSSETDTRPYYELSFLCFWKNIFGYDCQVLTAIFLKKKAISAIPMGLNVKHEIVAVTSILQCLSRESGSVANASFLVTVSQKELERSIVPVIHLTTFFSNLPINLNI